MRLIKFVQFLEQRSDSQVYPSSHWEHGSPILYIGVPIILPPFA